MATRAAEFYPTFVNQDFVAPGEDTILKMQESPIAENSDTRIVFGDGATNECTFRPFLSTASTAGTGAANSGWALNRDGADGMSVPDVPINFDNVERFIAAGEWTIGGTFLLSGGTTVGTYVMRAYLYRVTSTGSRTLIHTFGPSTAVIPSIVATEIAIADTLAEVVFAVDETLHVAWTAQKTNSGALTGATLRLRVGNSSTTGARVFMPAGPRTRYSNDVTLDARGTLTTRKSIAKTATVDARGTLDMNTSRVRMPISRIPDVDAPAVVSGGSSSGGGPPLLTPPKRFAPTSQTTVINITAPAVVSVVPTVTLSRSAFTRSSVDVHVTHHAATSVRSRIRCDRRSSASPDVDIAAEVHRLIGVRTVAGSFVQRHDDIDALLNL